MISLKRMTAKLGLHNHLSPIGNPYDVRERASISSSFTSQSATTDWRSTYETAPRQPRVMGSYTISDFIVQRTLGTGSFGRVYLVRSKHNLHFYAIKVLNKNLIVRSKQIEHTNSERQILGTIRHPFIITLWGSFQDSVSLYMVMDFVSGGELFTLLRRSQRFPDPVAKFYTAEVILAMTYLHSLGIIYRDLKPENILLNTDGHVKVADFGFAKECDNSTWTLCGTPDYLAPEIVRQQRYNHSVDDYAIGILAFELLTGLPPFHQNTGHSNPVILYENIERGVRAIPVWPHDLIGEYATDFIVSITEVDASKRIGNMLHGAADIFAHPWFREVDWTKLEAREITAPYLPRVLGEGDASAFDKYPEQPIQSFGGDDPYGCAFPDFEYTGPQAAEAGFSANNNQFLHDFNRQINMGS